MFDSIADVDFRVVDYGFTEKTTPATRELVRECLRPLYHPLSQNVDMSFTELLQLAIDRFVLLHHFFFDAFDRQA